MRLDPLSRARSLKFKLISSYLVILGIGGLVTSLVGSWIVSSTIMMQAQRTAEHDLVTARTIYEQQLDRLRQTVQLAASGVRAGLPLTTTDRDNLRAALETIRHDARIDFLSLADREGRVVLRVTQRDRTGDDVSGIAIVDAALAGNVAAATEVLTADQLGNEDPALRALARLRVVPTPKARPTTRTAETDGMVLLAAAPVRDPSGRPAGALYAGMLLNRRFAIVDTVWDLLYRDERYRRQDIGSVTIFLDDTRIATTIRTEDGERALGTQVSAAVADAVLGAGRPWLGRAFVVNDWYITAYEPIRSYEGRVVGMLYVGVLEKAYASIRNRVIVSFFAIATIGFILIIGITYVMIRNITRPIGEMVTATRSIAAGRFDQNVRADAQGEIALLAESFNTMLQSLRQMKGDLEDWGRTLEQKVHDRTQELMQMQMRVAQSERLASVGMLAAGVAHEINNPLGGILALTMLTLEDLPGDHPNRSNLEEVVRQTRRCRDIVKGLLDFSRQSDVSMEVLDVNGVIEQTLDLVAKQASFFNVEVVRHWAADLPTVTADRSQLQQVFLNILMNATQAMHEQGTITITTCPAETGAMVEVAIADTGCGIPREMVDRIFDPFFTTKSGGQGTGLGLAIAYGIVTRHHGTITVDSVVERGTTFTIRLPATGTADASAPSPHSSPLTPH
jgi:two-component system NtrC family sensor kinase